MTRITISDNGNHITIGLRGDGGFSVSLAHGDDSLELSITKGHMSAIYQAMSHLMNAQAEMAYDQDAPEPCGGARSLGRIR